MSKGVRESFVLSVLTLFLLMTAIAGLGHIYRYSTVNTYELIILTIIVIIIVVTLIFALSVSVVFYAYSKKHVNNRLLWIYSFGIKVLLPFITLLAHILKYNKDEIQRFYIDVNNIIVQSGDHIYDREQVLVLLPHCLQNSSCGFKITSDIKNCRKCGKCCIGEILDIAESTGVKTVVVTGGTLARNVISSRKPKYILSVACERDLTSGISDVSGIPVYGILNKRPNGPCNNTTMDIRLLKKKLESILRKI